MLIDQVSVGFPRDGGPPVRVRRMQRHSDVGHRTGAKYRDTPRQTGHVRQRHGGKHIHDDAGGPEIFPHGKHVLTSKQLMAQYSQDSQRRLPVRLGCPAITDSVERQRHHVGQRRNCSPPDL